MNRFFLLVVCILMLSGCKEDLYTGLQQDDANQMIVILTNANIEAAKQLNKDGSLNLSVDKKDFVDAVDVLHQHGYPRRAYQSVNDVFPSGQLVSSPAQEQVKINFLKEQSLEKMLSDIDGVIAAHVSVAIAQNDPGSDPVPASASVFIKYSPDINLDSFITQIKSLVHNSVPEISYETISVVLQPAQFLLNQQPKTTDVVPHKVYKKKIVYFMMIGVWVICLSIIGWGYYNRRKKRSNIQLESVE